MPDGYASLLGRTKAWFDAAIAAGWLDDAERQRFESHEQATPADLFKDRAARPLAVALFGGTGVGKSSLLNRLAGAALARTGVERPTSREVTLYVHEDVELEGSGLGAEGSGDGQSKIQNPKSKIVRHRIDSRRDVLWIDAPDIDSVEESNRRIALSWLPHVDLLIYVVSPERYRDDVGWKVLRQRGHRHGWIFVLNRWDEGDPGQVRDLRQILREAGFENPVLLCTSCAPQSPALRTPDQFAELEKTIAQLLAEHGVRELERLGQRARLNDLRTCLQAGLARLGDTAAWSRIEEARKAHWRDTSAALCDGLEWPMRELATRFALRGGAGAGAYRAVGGAVRRIARTVTAITDESPESRPSPPAPQVVDRPVGDDVAHLTDSLWDDWARSRLSECIDATEIDLRRAGVSAGPMRTRLEREAESARETILRHVQTGLRSALARPGAAWQRGLRIMTRISMFALPVVALVAVAVQVITAYYRAVVGGGGYLGQDFAIHSILLVLVAWALPFFADRLLTPSIERTAMRGMRTGLAGGLDELAGRMHEAWNECAAAAQHTRSAAEKLLADMAAFESSPLRFEGESLPRVVAHAQPAGALPRT